MAFNWSNILSPEEKIRMEFSLSQRFIFVILSGTIVLSVFVSIFSIIAGVFLLLFGLLYWLYMKKAKHYCFTTKRVIMFTSFIGSNTISIDYNQITDIETDQSFFDELGGWGTLTINTAGTNVPQTNISFIDNPQQVKQKLDEIRDNK